MTYRRKNRKWALRGARAVLMAGVSTMFGCDLVWGLQDLRDRATNDAGDGGTADDATTDGPQNADARAASYAAAVLADTPLGYWRLDDAVNSTSVHDETGHHDGTVEPIVQFGATGIAGTAASIPPGGFGRITLGDQYDFVGDVPFSIEAWVNPNYEGLYVDIADKRGTGPTGGNGGWVIFFDNSQTATALRMQEDWNGGGYYCDVPIVKSGWLHVVFTYSGGGTGAFFVNGVATACHGSPSALPNLNAPFRWAGDGFTGRMDEVAVYDHALAPSRVQVHYDLGKP